MKLSARDIQTIKTYFAGQPVIKAYLFGSYSRGEADKDSDVDILVELDYSQHIGLKFFGMHMELGDMLNKKVDVVSEKGMSPYIAPFINKDKLLIYER